MAHGLARVVPAEGVKIGDRVFSEGVCLPEDVLLTESNADNFQDSSERQSVGHPQKH